MASSPWADSRAAARSAALAWAVALAASMLRRMRPQTSGSQLAPMLARYWVVAGRAARPPVTMVVPPAPVITVPPPAAGPLPDLVPLPVRSTVGNRLARCSLTMARAWR